LENLVAKYDSLRDMHQMQLQEASSEKVEQLQLNGDLITAYLYTWKDNDAKIKCHDFDTGKDIFFTLGPGQTPVDLAASFYKKSKKLRRSISIVTSIIDQINITREYLNELDASLSILEKYMSYNDFIALADIEVEIDQIRKLVNDDINEINAKAVNRKINSKIKKTANGKKTRAQPQTANTNLKKISKALQGLLVVKPTNIDSTLPPVIVGRSAKQNDRISFEVAKEHHIWFHVQGSPGAHCLLALEPGQEVNETAIQYAADVAAFYSKARGSTNVPVTYCNPKNLKRMKGAAPGMVSILQGNGLNSGVKYGNPDRGRLFSEDKLQ
jgi:predicted ribosome quality control (RQC) complex YloA/Tae2 family protein